MNRDKYIVNECNKEVEGEVESMVGQSKAQVAPKVSSRHNRLKLRKRIKGSSSGTLEIEEKLPGANEKGKNIDFSTKHVVYGTNYRTLENNAVTVGGASLLDSKKISKSFEDRVYSHIITSMRPFTLVSLANELRTSHVYLNSIILPLLEKKVIKRKVVGKKVKREIYWVDLEKVTKKRQFLNDESRFAKQRLKSLEYEEARLVRELKKVYSQPSNNDLDRRLCEETKHVQDLTKLINESKERISIGKDFARGTSSLKPKKPRTKKRLQQSINHMRNEWVERKRKCSYFLDELSDAMEEKPKEVMKLLKIETDEMAGEQLPPKHIISRENKKQRQGGQK